MRNSLTTLAALMVIAAITGCTTSTNLAGAAYDRAQRTGALSERGVNLANDMMNREFENRIIAAYSEGAHRQALDTYSTQARDQVTGNAAETAIRNAQGLINAQAAGGDVRSARQTGEEVNEQMLQMLKSIRESQSDMQIEIDRLREGGGDGDGN